MAWMHPDYEFHPALDSDPESTETCWLSFAVPEHRLSEQVYPFFRPNQLAKSGAACFRNDQGDQPWNSLNAKNFWHLPMPDAPLSNLRCANKLRIRCLDPSRGFAIGYLDLDGNDGNDGNDGIDVELEFEAIPAPHYLGIGHLNQPDRSTGRIALRGREYGVDSYGFRGRPWGLRSQFGHGIVPKGPSGGGYTDGAASPRDAFHLITARRGKAWESYHGYSSATANGQCAPADAAKCWRAMSRRAIRRACRSPASMRSVAAWTRWDSASTSSVYC